MEAPPLSRCRGRTGWSRDIKPRRLNVTWTCPTRTCPEASAQGPSGVWEPSRSDCPEGFHGARHVRRAPSTPARGENYVRTASTSFRPRSAGWPRQLSIRQRPGGKVIAGDRSRRHGPFAATARSPTACRRAEAPHMVGAVAVKPKCNRETTRMSRDLGNQLLVNAGSILATNGLILLIAPRRFAVLRSTAWTPGAFDRGLDRLTSRRGLARGAGILAALAGITMVTYGIMRTDPGR